MTFTTAGFERVASIKIETRLKGWIHIKKIYLEKQFIKATNNNNGYVIGEIVSVGGNICTIKKQDGSILTVFSHAILGWEDYKEQCRSGRKAFTSYQLEKLIYTGVEKLEGKTIYTLDVFRRSNGTNMTGLTVAKLTNEGIVVEFNDILRGTYKNMVKSLLTVIKAHNQPNVEIHLDITGLGIGLLDYLKGLPYTVFTYCIKDPSESHSRLIEKVENEKIKFMCNLMSNTSIEVLNDLDIITYSNGKTMLRPHSKDEEKRALLGSLLIAACSDDKYYEKISSLQD